MRHGSTPPDRVAPMLARLPHRPDPRPVRRLHRPASTPGQRRLSAIRPVTEQVTPTLSVDGTHARLVPVMATAMKATPASVQFAADKAASAGKLLMIVKTAAPIGLYTLGLALIIVAIVRRRKPAPIQAAVPGAVEALVHA